MATVDGEGWRNARGTSGLVVDRGERRPITSAAMKVVTRIAILPVVSILGCSSPSAAPDPRPRTDGARVEPATAAAPSSAVGEATLFLMADLNGVLRPCGCTVELQKGGFDRLIPWLEAQRQRHPGAELLHAGPMFYEGPEVEAKKKAQRERQVEVVADLIAKAGIAVAGATAVDEVASGGAFAELAARARVQVTAANLETLGAGAKARVVPRYVVREVGGIRFGIFALAAPVEGSGVRVGDPDAAAAAALDALRSESDVVVLLSGSGRPSGSSVGWSGSTSRSLAGWARIPRGRTRRSWSVGHGSCSSIGRGATWVA
jgi:2',3'-cyclic-nucleotide 2'-phosphodiesterase (5'-nucleotidase family)